MAGRIGGYFPFDLTDANHGGGVISLASGQMFYPRSGNYVWGPGAQTVLQWFDPVLGAWRVLAQPDSGFTPFVSDGANWRLVNLSGVCTGASITNAGSGGTNGIGSSATGVTVAVAASGGTGPAAQLTPLAYPVVGGSVPVPTITTAGSGFVVPPLIVCDPPPYGGIQATFLATLNSLGGIGSITQVNPGAGYTAIPKFYIIPQSQYYQGATSGGVAAASLIVPGFIDPTMVPFNTPSPGFNTASQSSPTPGALLTGNALTGSGTLTGVVFYYYGGQFTGPPAITITGCGAASATALMSLCATSITVAGGGVGYGSGTAPIWVSSLGLVAASSYDSILVPRAARGVTTLSAGAVNGATIEDNGFGLQKAPVAAVLNTSAIPTGIATLTVNVGGVTDSSILQSQVTT